MKKRSIHSLVYISVSAALLAVCAWITIPMTIPFTMQTFGVFMIAALLPMWDAVIAVAVYLLLGIIGLPVFSAFRSGIGVLLSATGGYLIGFLFQALLQGFLLKKLGSKVVPMVISMVAGLAVCYLFGTIWFSQIYMRGYGFFHALSVCVVPYLPADAAKCALAVLLVPRIRPWMHRN